MTAEFFHRESFKKKKEPEVPALFWFLQKVLVKQLSVVFLINILQNSFRVSEGQVEGVGYSLVNHFPFNHVQPFG